MIFCTIENIPPAIQNDIAFTCTLLQINTDCFSIDKIENKTWLFGKTKIIRNKLPYSFSFHISLTFLLVFAIIKS